MTSLLFGIITAALLSFTSLVTVYFRVSPLTAPMQALPAFFLSLFLTISSVGALAFSFLWRLLPWHTWDAGTVLSISVRQGLLLGGACVTLLLFHMGHLLNWWIGIMIVAVFVLVELAMEA